MVNIDEQIEKKLNEQFEKIKRHLIIFNTIQDLTDKIQKLEVPQIAYRLTVAVSHYSDN